MYKLGRLLGKGAFGEVYELLDKKDKKDKVIKFIKLSYYGIDNYLECYVLLNLKHKNLLSSYQISLEKNTLKMVFDKAECTLFDQIYNREYFNKYEVAKNLTEGLSYLHSHNILHGDIKPENVLCFSIITQLENSRNSFRRRSKYIKKHKIWKLADFGMARLCSISFTTDMIYTDIYRPPEIYNYTIDLKSDIWALGCTFYEIWCREKYFTFTRICSSERDGINSGTGTFHINKLNKEEKIYNIIKEMMRRDFQNRITSKELCEKLGCKMKEIDEEKHKIINNINLKKIEDYYNLDENNSATLKKKIYGQTKKKKTDERWKEIEEDIVNRKFNFLDYLFF